MIRHQYGISALAPQTSFRGETSGGVMKCRLLSQATIQEASYVFVFTAFECYIKISYLDIIVYRTDLLVDEKFVKSNGDE